jgi:hypothetical protein
MSVSGPNSVLRRCRFNVRFARKRTRLKRRAAPRSVRQPDDPAVHLPRPARALLRAQPNFQGAMALAASLQRLFTLALNTVGEPSP